MLRKYAKVIQGEYQEWTKNEGPIQPTTQQEKSGEFQSELLPVSIGRIQNKYNFSFTKQTGFRVA